MHKSSKQKQDVFKQECQYVSSNFCSAAIFFRLKARDCVATRLVGHKLARGNKHAKLAEAETQVTFA